MTKACNIEDNQTSIRSFYMLDPSTLVTVTPPPLRQKHKVLIKLDKYAKYANDLTHVEASGHLVSLKTKSGSILIRQHVNAQTKSVVLNPGDYFNLFGSSRIVDKKAKVSVLSSPPVQATSVTITLIRSGEHKVTNFTQHLKVYFTSPKILHSDHVFCLRIPENTPPSIPLDVWLKHMASNDSFVHPSISVHFKVVSATAGDTAIPDFFYISSDKTTLYEVSNTHQNLPSCVPNKRVALFYSPELEVLEGLLKRDVFVPLMLSGQKGSCKGEVAQDLAGRLGVGLYHVTGVDYCGEAPGALEKKFKPLAEHIALSVPCLVYVDSLELLGRTRDGGSVDPRVVLAVSQVFESVRKISETGEVYLVGSCCELQGVVMSIRHLFDSHVCLPDPTEDKLYDFLTDFVNFDKDSELEKTVKRRLHQMSLRKTIKFLDELQMLLGLGLNDHQAVSLDQCKDIFKKLRLSDTTNSSSVPDTQWEDIGGIDHVRREIEETIEIPLKYAELFGPGVRRSGLLLHGKPGCGKTMVARAVASQCNLSFISVQGPELLNSFVGQSEDNVRKIFENARKVAPTVLFFDEIDAIAPRRSGGVMDRVLAQLLSEMDGIQSSNNVFVIAATNRPELLDPAIMRPGRLDKRVEVSVGADAESRVQVFRALSRNLKLADKVCFKTVAEFSGPLSGAECYGVLLEACYKAIERCVQVGNSEVVVNLNDLISTIHSRGTGGMT